MGQQTQGTVTDGDDIPRACVHVEGAKVSAHACDICLRTNGVDTNGAAAMVMTFDRLWKKVRPGTFGKIQMG